MELKKGRREPTTETELETLKRFLITWELETETISILEIETKKRKLLYVEIETQKFWRRS